MKLNKKIKVVNVITKLDLGGAQKVALYSADNLGENFISYFVSGEEGLLDKNKKYIYKNITEFFNISDLQRKIKPIKDFLAFLRLIMLFKKLKPDIVHLHTPKAGIIGRWAAFFSRVPIIIHTYHGFGFNDYQNKLARKFYIFLEKISCFIVDKLIAVSVYGIEKALKEKIGRKDLFTVIRCGIDINKYKNKNINIKVKKQELGIPENFKIVGSVTSLKPFKAPIDFVKIAFEISKKHKDVFFIIVGDGEIRANVEAEIEKFRLKDKIKLLGWRQDIEDILKLFDVFILTTLSEGLPMAILESMAAGIPVIATNVDGNKEAIQSGYNGFLLECHDINGFVDKIEYLLNNKNLSEKFVKNSYEFLIDEFDKKNVVKKIVNLYLEFIWKIK